MPITDYTYTKATFVNAPAGPNLDTLKQEVNAALAPRVVHQIDAPDDIIIYMDDALDSGQETALDGVVAAHLGDPMSFTPPSLTVKLETEQADSVPLVAIAGRVARGFNYGTHNYCDKSTWYSESIRHVNQTAVEVGNRWILPHEYIIDMYHGRVMDEEGNREDQALFNPGDPHEYKLVVTVDGVEVTEANPFQPTTGDYCIDYHTGIIKPHVPADWTGKTVQASYSIAGQSGWILRPLGGRVLEIERSEVQFSNPFEYTTAIIFEAWGSVEFFAPHLLTTNGGPLPPGTPIPLESTVWKNLDQINDEAVGSLPEIPAMGGNVRGTTLPRHILQFYYPGVRKIFSSLGMYLRIYLQDDIPFNGERATATFYGTSLIDPGPAVAALELQA